jgi:hypothetical protein
MGIASSVLQTRSLCSPSVASYYNPKGIVAFSPRLPREIGATLGSQIVKFKQPQRGCGQRRVMRTKTEWSQPRCGCDVCWTMTQGSAFRTTLGFGPESRWDSIWFNPKRISRPIRSRAFAATRATRPGSRSCDDAPPARRFIALPIRAFSPFNLQPIYAGCCGLKSFPAFAFAALSILMSGGQGRLNFSPGNSSRARPPDSLSPIGGEGWGEGAGLGRKPAISSLRPVRSSNPCQISNRTASSSPRN